MGDTPEAVDIGIPHEASGRVAATPGLLGPVPADDGKAAEIIVLYVPVPVPDVQVRTICAEAREIAGFRKPSDQGSRIFRFLTSVSVISDASISASRGITVSREAGHQACRATLSKAYSLFTTVPPEDTHTSGHSRTLTIT